MSATSRAALMVCLAGLFSTAQATETKTVKIATEGAFPPWNAIDSSGKPVGFDIDVGYALCEKAGLKCEFVAQAWDGIIPGLTVGKYDAIMAGMSITEKRRRVIAFSEPYAVTANYFVLRNDIGVEDVGGTQAIDLTTMGDPGVLSSLRAKLKGRTIGVQGATNAEVFINEYFGQDVSVRIYDKQDSLNLDILAGRIDGGLADLSVWQTFLKDNSSIARTYGPRISGGVFGQGIGIGVRKSDAELAEKFNNAIDALATSGALTRMSIKWFAADVTPSMQ
ncbi:transporter substrate-binding domain-containing protein [Agrobacterium salinitolerans]|uniref:transporter substrate-binding domain-containing protein n=1 Tax=Agrobacterium salinitolerans TaxID=1183413 RepID=UPI001FCECE27|nr:transporter substrate-binding domain-containing protein [Agrobacterium salinitolerans]